MNIEVEAISVEIIKPSSPTPKNIGHYKLSLIDQSAPLFYDPLVFYYTKKSTTTNINPTNILKRSLSAILTHYYPLAGRLDKHGEEFIHCNDEGVPFVKAQVNARLSQVLSNPVAQELGIFCPLLTRHHESDDAHQILLGVQLNMFECGGIAVGISISDKIADALSWMRFIKTWAMMARDGTTATMLPKSLHPEFVSADLFPPRPQSVIEIKNEDLKEGIMTKIFVFNSFAIEALRAMYWDKENKIRPSRVETLSTFMLSRFEAALSEAKAKAKAKPEKERVYTILHTVNLHPRMNPPLAENSFGNFLVYAGTQIPASSIKGEASITSGLAMKIREAVKRLNKEYVSKLQMGEEGELSMIQQNSESIEKRGGEVIEFLVTSLSRFHFYEIDFGWGKPDWFSTGAWSFDKIIAFIDTSDGKGIEAYVNLKEEDMAIFEADEMLRKFTTPNYYSRHNINSNL
ncbi:stemmadenine O-acetyltransferase-like [Cannabis sativa]|uniref:Transferase n=1 Tax=Cannabis sativa TaxID=3483 RepID=A0A7J6F1U3_CANSA|nr:stemmadenine O-acetyltransferase-like [Cannabis sativa]KAF4364674.1 hypothetical protein G4B88_028597 [Cannabis sativa]